MRPVWGVECALRVDSKNDASIFCLTILHQLFLDLVALVSIAIDFIVPDETGHSRILRAALRVSKVTGRFFS